MRIDQGTIREILSKTDIGVLIGSYVQLQKRGNDLVGLCPFHGEKTPSFHVHPDRGFFKCFGCQEAGDAFKFVQLHESLAFPEAVRMLAQRAGVTLEEEDSSQARVRNEKELIYTANNVAAAFFHRTLRFAPEAEFAREYVAKRGLDAATIDAFKIGYAPNDWHALENELDANGVERETAETAGLLRRGERGNFYDFFRNRLMIPTYATTGEAVAFGGRSLDGSEPKYFNTQTTPVYTKGSGLYALNIARRAAKDSQTLIVVEGYLDCIALHQSGFSNAVAALGTAFTPQQGVELRKFAERIFLCYDADSAGANATVKSIDVLGDAGCSAFIVQLAPGEDPDTFIRTHGAAAFQTRLDGALPWIQYKLDREVAEIRSKRLPRAQAAARAEALVHALPRTEWDRWRVYAAQALDLSIDDLRVSRFAADPASFAPRGNAGTRHVALTAEPPSIERDVLAALVDEPVLFAEYADRFPANFFRDTRYARIFATLSSQNGGLTTSEDVYAVLASDRDAVETIVTLLKPDRSSQVRFQDSEARRAHLDRVLERIDTERLEDRYKELDAKIDESFHSGSLVSPEERDEHRRLREEREKQRKKRLGARS